MSDRRSGLIPCQMPDRRDEQWLLDTLLAVIDIPGIEAIEIERTSVESDEFLLLSIEYSSTTAWERLRSDDDRSAAGSLLDCTIVRLDG